MMTALASTAITDEPAPEAATEATERLTDATMRDEMSAVFDSMNGPEAKEEHFKAQPPLPQYRGETQPTIEDTFRRVSDWMEKPLEERQTEAQTQRTVEQLKADAARYGLTINEAGALDALAKGAANPEWKALSDRIAVSAPNQKPHETVSRLVDVAEFMDRDPVQGLQWVAQLYGLQITGLNRVV